MHESVYHSHQTHELINYIRQEYGDELEFLWAKSPTNAIWRNPLTHKWYGLLMVVPRHRIVPNSTSNDLVEILDLRFDKGEAPDFISANPNIYPGYHMNKSNWITIILDNSLETSQIISLLHHSRTLSANK